MSLFKKKNFFSITEKKQIVEAINLAEKETSGEIRIFVEEKNPFVNPVDRAAEIFFKLKMDQTTERNAVLLYIATRHKELALFAGEGIYNKVGKEYWNDAVKIMIDECKKNHIVAGIEKCIKQIGETLKEKFPYSASDKNELSNNIAQ